MTISRRSVIRGVGASLALSQTLWSMSSANVHFGAQTNAWSIDTKNLESFLDVLRQIKRTGYEGFETGYFNLVQHLADQEAVRAHIQSIGLRFFGFHVAVGADKCDKETRFPRPEIYEPLARIGKKRGAENWILNEEDSDGKQKLGLDVIGPAYKALEAAFSHGA